MSDESRPLDLSDLYPRPVDLKEEKRTFSKNKRQKWEHPVMKGRSPNFIFLLKGQKEKSEVILPRPINKILLEAAKKAKKPFIKKFGKNLGEIRKFLVFHLAPKMLPLISAVEDSKEVLTEVLGEEVNSTIYSTFIKQIEYAAEARVSTFVADYLNLDENERERFLERIYLEKVFANELSKLQKVGRLPGSGEGQSGVFVPQVRGVQRRLQKRRFAGFSG